MDPAPTRPPEDALRIARVVGEHGVGGALRIFRYDAASQLPFAGLKIWLCFAEGPQKPRLATVERVSHKPGSELSRVWLQELQGRDEAQTWRGAELLVERDLLPELEEDEFYLADLIGLAVKSVRAPELTLGRVEGVIDNVMQDLLEIQWVDSDSSRRIQWLLPAVEAYIESFDEDDLWVDLPVGLLPAHLERAVEADAALALSAGSSSEGKVSAPPRPAPTKAPKR